jgi:hypothetical protein
MKKIMTLFSSWIDSGFSRFTHWLRSSDALSSPSKYVDSTFYGHFIFCSMKIQSMVFQGKRVLLCVVAREHNPSDLITSYILDSH